MMIRSIKSSSEERGTICFVLLFLLLGAVAINYVKWNKIKGSHFLNINSLNTTSGTIISSQTILGTPRSPGLSYEIKYQYKIKDKIFFSDQITFTYVGNVNYDFAISYVHKYPVGRLVTVYYDPLNPSFSVLEPREKGSYIGLMASPFILGILFILSVWYYLINRSSDCNVPDSFRD